MNIEIIAAGLAGFSMGVLVTKIIDIIDTCHRMKMMLNGAKEYAQIEEDKKKTRKK